MFLFQSNRSPRHPAHRMRMAASPALAWIDLSIRRSDYYCTAAVCHRNSQPARQMSVVPMIQSSSIAASPDIY